MPENISNNPVILYTENDGNDISLRVQGDTVWLSQKGMGELFKRSHTTIIDHLKNIFEEGELEEASVCREFRHTAPDGKEYLVKHYNLAAILAVGFRVKSPQGTQFRKWANTTLQEYLVKGFAMDDAKLMQAEQWDYFDEWLERIRAIRASEKRFYQQVKDLFATAVDYDKTAETAQLFYQKIQNKMLWACTGHTAAELIANRADASQPNMGLTSWKGGVVRKGDVGTAKNYLQKEEVDALNRLVNMYLDYAEDKAKRREPVNMAQMMEKLDAFLTFNEREVLTHAGHIEATVAKALAEDAYETFDATRKEQARLHADADDIAELEALAKQLEGKSA